VKNWKKILVGLALGITLFFLLVLPRFKRHAQSITCGNFMSSYCWAASNWADDREGLLPTNLMFLKEWGPPKWLICPGDSLRSPASGWESFSSLNSSYEIITNRVQNSDTNTAFMRCKIHGHLGFSYGYVFDGVERRTKKPL
jgi:hypothetical protein